MSLSMSSHPFFPFLLNKVDLTCWMWEKFVWWSLASPNKIILDIFHRIFFSSNNMSLNWIQVTLLFVVQVSISSTFFARFFVRKSILAAFSSYILTLAKNLYEKRSQITLMKLTIGICGFDSNRKKTRKTTNFSLI